MQIWKLHACSDDAFIGGRWGFALASTEEAAAAAGHESSKLPCVRAYRMRDEMIWPGAPKETLFWSS